MAILGIVRGLPGSGKSTFANVMAEKFSALHVEADMFFMLGGKYMYSRKFLQAAHDWCLAKAKFALSSDANVLVANTFTTMKEMKPYIEYAVNNRHHVSVFEMKGDYGSIHLVPADAIEKMTERWEDLDIERLKKNYVYQGIEHVFVEASEPPQIITLN